MQETMELVENLRVFLKYKESGSLVNLDNENIEIVLDLPSEENYNFHIDLIEEFMEDEYITEEDYSIDGDYEGSILLIKE